MCLAVKLALVQAWQSTHSHSMHCHMKLGRDDKHGFAFARDCHVASMHEPARSRKPLLPESETAGLQLPVHACRMIAIATVPKTDSFFVNNLLGLPTEALAIMDAEFQFDEPLPSRASAAKQPLCAEGQPA